MTFVAGFAERGRPPPGAAFDAELDAWEICERDANGDRHGDSTLYRNDGSVLLRCRYVGGKRNGVFTTYHANGELASEGSYTNGLLDGMFVRHASTAPGSEPLRRCCVPRGAKTLRASYRSGSLVQEVFYDADDRALLSDGTLAPERARGVPDDAEFDEDKRHWVARLTVGADAELERWFALDGRLVEEVDVVARRIVGQRSFDETGKPCAERAFDRAGRLHGPRRLVHSEDAPYADARVREERGSFEHGQATGVFRYFDGDGTELFSKDRGVALADESLRELFASPIFDEPAQGLFRRADELERAGRVREAILVSAGACSKLGSIEKSRELIDTRAIRLKPEVARARAGTLDETRDIAVSHTLDALLAGADPAGVLRLVAVLVPSVSPAARLLADAALLFAPERPRLYVTRALIRLEQGDGAGALDDVSALGAEYDEAALHVRELVRILFAKPDFAPPREPPPAPEKELVDVGVDQPLEVVRRGITLYATRLGMLRNEILRRLGGSAPEWLVPDPSHLLTSGPIPLERRTTTIVDEEDGDSEASEVEIDETLVVENASVKTLAIVARAEFDALSWLCWSAGLDEIALPTVLVPRADFAAAVNAAMLRCWRVHDQLSTGGLVSKSRSVPGFEWQGLSVEKLTPPLAEIAAYQYRERRAMFFWLMFSQNLSPFQSDLRKI